MSQRTEAVVTAMLWYAMVLGLVFAVVAAATGAVFVVTRPHDLIANSLLFTASKIGFFFLFCPAYILGFTRGGSRAPLTIAAAITCLLWIDFAISCRSHMSLQSVLVVAVVSGMILVYGMLIMPSTKRPGETPPD